MPPADGSHATRPALQTIRCACCEELWVQEDLNRNQLCIECADPEYEPEEGEEYAPDEAYLRRWEGTFSI
jgi:hypothetical protein